MNYFQIVKDVIDSWDPEGLFPYAPDDEYDQAIMAIAPSIVTATSVDDMTFAIYRGLNSTFGDYRSTECRTSAKRIWHKIHSNSPDTMKKDVTYLINRKART